ncbi:hypothetical protein [Dyadobacter bucti]|uniref:hypothetical protein n=1 Tax=Dyadobacter bucti TaxID=2572203 RepID=UPI003F7161DF
MDELVKRYHERRREGQRRLAHHMSANLSRLPVSLQQAMFLTALGIGAGYCILLILPNSFSQLVGHSLLGLTSSHQTIKVATPSPKQQALQNYLDSLERASVTDSLFQSQQTIEDHAEKSIHP